MIPIKKNIKTNEGLSEIKKNKNIDIIVIAIIPIINNHVNNQK